MAFSRMASLAVPDQAEDVPQDLQVARRSAANLLVPVVLDRIVVQFGQYRSSLIPNLAAVLEVLLETVGLAPVMPLENKLSAAVYLT